VGGGGSRVLRKKGKKKGKSRKKDTLLMAVEGSRGRSGPEKKDWSTVSEGPPASLLFGGGGKGGTGTKDIFNKSNITKGQPARLRVPVSR